MPETGTTNLLSLLGSAPRTVADLARRVSRVTPDTTCDHVMQLFQDDPELPGVIACDGTRLGLISRAPFHSSLRGRLGFGGALYGSRPVSALTDWSPLVLPVATSVEAAAARVLGEASGGQRDVLVECPDGEVAIVPAMTLLRALSSGFARRSLHDHLTGLPNRELFLSHLSQATATARRDRPAVFFLDVDGLKAVNDQLGHSAGDSLLRHVASQLTSAARPGDLVARLAGDEFAVLLAVPGSSRQVELVRELAQRLLTAVATPLLLAGRHVAPRISIGVAVAGPDADDETLIREADLAMYRAKRAGGHRVVLVENVGNALGRSELGALGVDDTLSRALADGQFQLHYQPIVHAVDGTVASVEALVRWAHPTAGLQAPGKFLPEAERTGFIVELGAWVLDEACRQLAEWDRTLHGAAPAAMNVNLAIRQLADPRLVTMVEQTLRRHDLSPERLVLELPEGATLAQLTDAAEPVRQLRALGVRFTLDDVGTGASSLGHLSALTIDGIKIDRSFVNGMLTVPSDAAVVRLLIELSRALGVPATAEGVETPEQLHALAELGCTYLQGFHLGRPADQRAISTWIVARPGDGTPIPHGQLSDSGSTST